MGEEKSGIIFNVMRYSVHDGPGIRTTVFFKGCPLRCRWCHNPESFISPLQATYRPNRCLRCGDCLPACPAGAIDRQGGDIVTDWAQCRQCGDCVAICPAEAREVVGRITGATELMEEIARDTIFFDESGGGVTFSGGEPLLQPEFLLSLLQACRTKGIHTAIDTTGYAPPEIVEQISDWTDLFLYDLKVVDEARHLEYTGVSNTLILKNLQWLAARGKAIIIRIPVIPGMTDTPENIRQVGEFVAALPNVVSLELLPYHAAGLGKYERLRLNYTMPETAQVTPAEVDRIACELQQYGIRIEIGGEA
jgi:pyruvate formate lyase activating enzyme